MGKEIKDLINLIPFEDIEKHAIIRKHKFIDRDFVRKNFDIKIIESTQRGCKGINITFGDPVFTKFDYIVFYALKNFIVFKLTNNYDASKTYTISQNPKRESVYCTKVAGAGYDLLKNFIGTHDMRKYIYSDEQEPVFYIQKSIDSNEVLKIL